MENLITSQSLFFITSVLIGILLRWNVGFGPYSGMNKPPLYGDYEAQRHWQEITLNTPAVEWYKNTTNNDLLYWGLDYPPLTAYHSWLCGYIAKLINPDWVALRDSRGTEGYRHKLFMRYSVLMADILILFPALYFLFNIDSNKNLKRETLIQTLLYPGLILIDYGHFQYNNVSLGFFILAVCFLQRDRDLFGAFFFSLALNYKQMELYHSLPFFCYLLGKSLKSGLFKGTIKIAEIGVIVLGTFAICWLPFLNNLDDVLQVLNRLFPLNRGLYEDKVANFWCSISPVLKLKQLLSTPATVRLCTVTTLLASLPSALHLLFRPSMRSFKYSCVNVSLAFFLFSFQVHEKSILIPAVSACLLYNEVGFLVTWFLYTTTFSMVPLLMKDGLWLQFLCMKYIFMIVSYFVHENAAKPSSNLIKILKMILLNCVSSNTVRKILWYKFLLSILAMEILTAFAMTFEPPKNLPDLWPVLISTLSCFLFLCSFLYFNLLQFLPGTKAALDSKKRK